MLSRQQKIGIFLTFISLCVILLFLNFHNHTQTLEQLRDMSITHIVLFQFKTGVSADVVKDVSQVLTFTIFIKSLLAISQFRCQ